MSEVISEGESSAIEGALEGGSDGGRIGENVVWDGGDLNISMLDRNATCKQSLRRTKSMKSGSSPDMLYSYSIRLDCDGA